MQPFSATTLLTLEEIEAQGISHDEPHLNKCRWCGETLEPLGIVGRDGRILWVSSKECACEGAAKERAEEEEREREAAEREQIANFKRSGVKPRFLNAQIEVPAIAKFLDSYEHKSGQGLYIAGPSRAGKTYAASAIAKAFCASGYSVILTTSLSMLDSVKASFDGDTRNGIARFSGCDVLIIDDIGKENANSWVMTTLFQIINERYESMKTTIVTSQYAPEDLKHRMSRSGEQESAVAIVERLKETCHLIRLPARRNVRLMDEVPSGA